MITDGTALLFPSRIANASFSGSIAGLGTGRSLSRAMDGFGSIPRIVNNLNDTAQRQSFSTDEDGNYTVPKIIPGDDFAVTVDGQTTVVTPAVDGVDVGTITVTQGVNFKTSISTSARFPYSYPRREYILEELYADPSPYAYIFTITITNTGTEDATAAMYQLSLDKDLSIYQGQLSGTLGTIEPGKFETLDAYLQCDAYSIQDYYEFKTIGIKITDTIRDKTWNDSISL